MSDRARRRLPAHRDLRAWDARTIDGTLVTTIADLAALLGLTAADTARWVRAHECERAMPAELVAEAHQIR